MEGWEVGAVGAEERKRVLAVGGQGPVGGWQRAVVWLAGLPLVMPRCWTREGLEEYAVAEHDVTYTAFHAIQ